MVVWSHTHTQTHMRTLRHAHTHVQSTTDKRRRSIHLYGCAPLHVSIVVGAIVVYVFTQSPELNCTVRCANAH